MRTLRVCLVAALVAGVLTAAGVQADTPAPVPPAAGAAPGAVKAPASAMVYVEAQKAKVDELLGMAATMPVMRLFMPTMQSRFALVEQLLHLAPGSFDAAAPHLTRLAVVVWNEQPMAVLSFDEAGWAEKIVQGAEAKGDAGGVVALSESISAVVHGTDLAIGSQAACAAVANGEFEAFTKSADFQAARASAGDAPLWGYVNVQAVSQSLAAADASASSEVGRVTALLGLDTVPYAVLTVQGKGSEGAAVLTLKLAEDQGGLLGLLPQGAPQMPALVPAGTSASVVLDWGNPVVFFANLRFLLSKDHQALQQMETAQEALGVKWVDLIGTVGSGAAVFLPAPGPDGTLSRGDVTIVLHLKDVAGFRTSVEAILKRRGQELSPTTVDGTEMLQLMAPPAYMKFMDDRLVIGASPAAVNRYLKAQFPPAAAGKPAEEPVGALVARFDLGLLTTSYPKPESGTKFYITLLRDGRDLKLSVGYKDLDPANLSKAYMGFVAGMFFGTVWPAMEQARGVALRASGESNLHQIGSAITMYRAEHDDQFPPDLEALVEGAFLSDPKVFVDPGDGSPQVRGAKRYRYSYEYAGLLPAMTPKHFIIAYTRKGLNPQGPSPLGRNVLCVDNRVMFVTEKDLHEKGNGGRGASLQEQYDWLMEKSGVTFTDEQKAAFRKFYEVDAGGMPVAPAPSAAPAVPLSGTPGPMIMPVRVRARTDAQKAQGMGNLHNIGLGIAMYRGDHKMSFPPDMEPLLDYLSDPKVFVDPSDKTPQVRGAKGYPYSYEYPGALPDDMPPTYIVACSRKGVYPDGRIMLYVDGSVQFLTEEQLHQDGGGRGNSLKQQYDWLMEHHGAEFTDAQKAAFARFYEVETPAAAPAPAAPKPAQ